MLSRRFVFLAVFVGGAVAAQLGLLLVSEAWAACPETTPKNVTCPHDEDGECQGDATTCGDDIQVSTTFSQPMEDKENEPEQTKTQTDTHPDNKVVCYMYQECKWTGSECVPDAPIVKTHHVNPLKEVGC